MSALGAYDLVDDLEGFEKAAELVCGFGEIPMLISTRGVVLVKVLCTLQAERQQAGHASGNG